MWTNSLLHIYKLGPRHDDANQKQIYWSYSSRLYPQLFHHTLVAILPRRKEMGCKLANPWKNLISGRVFHACAPAKEDYSLPRSLFVGAPKKWLRRLSCESMPTRWVLQRAKSGDCQIDMIAK